MRHRRVNERGAAAIMVCYSCLLLAVMGIGAATLGRLVVAKRDAQQAADAAALGSIDAVRANGRQVPPGGSLDTGKRNTRNPMEVRRTLFENAGDKMAFSRGTASQLVEVPRFIFPAGAFEVRAQATARIGQERRLGGVRPRADITLVLDYSGSMSGAPVEELRRVVKDHILLLDLPADYAAVFFDSGIKQQIDFSEPNAVDAIVNALQQDTGSGTGTGQALNTAADIVEKNPGQDNEVIVLVTDGAPTEAPDGADPEQYARDAATRIWDQTKATIFTLHIAADSLTTPFMIDVSGTPDNRHSEDYYFNPQSADEFRSAIAEIISSIVCPVDALDPATADDPEQVQAFLERNGLDMKLPMVQNLVDPNALEAKFNPNSRTITFSIAACKLIANEGHRAVIRYRKPLLIE